MTFDGSLILVPERDESACASQCETLPRSRQA